MENADRQNIVLTGPASVELRDVARRIATVDGRNFVDIDGEFVASHGDPTGIIDTAGAEHLAQLERDLVTSFAPRRNLVIVASDRTMADQDNLVALVSAEIFSLSNSADSPTDQRFTTVSTHGKSTEEVIDELRSAGASISGRGQSETVSVASADSIDPTTRIFVYIIAAAVAVLIVLLVLVLSF